jgi:hypothetical protein
MCLCQAGYDVDVVVDVVVDDAVDVVVDVVVRSRWVSSADLDVSRVRP